jgi:hypothetical protein
MTAPRLATALAAILLSAIPASAQQGQPGGPGPMPGPRMEHDQGMMGPRRIGDALQRQLMLGLVPPGGMGMMGMGQGRPMGMMSPGGGGPRMGQPGGQPGMGPPGGRPGMGPPGGQPGMGPGMRPGMMGQSLMIEHIEGHIAFVKAELKITDAQAKLWDALAAAMRANAQQWNALMMEATAARTEPPKVADRLAAIEKSASVRLDMVRRSRPALAALAATFSPEQAALFERLFGAGPAPAATGAPGQPQHQHQ